MNKSIKAIILFIFAVWCFTISVLAFVYAPAFENEVQRVMLYATCMIGGTFGVLLNGIGIFILIGGK